MSADMSLLPEMEPVEPEPVKYTERMMLDAIHERHRPAPYGNGPRYVVAEHVRNQCGFGGDYFGSGQPMPFGMTAALLRAAVKTASR